MNTPSTPEIEVKEHPNFRTISVGGAYSTQNGMRFEVMVYSEHVEVSEALASVQQIIPTKYIRTLECRLVIDPFRAKLITQTLTAQLNAFEQQWGHIPSNEELQQKSANTEEAKKKTAGVT